MNIKSFTLIFFVVLTIFLSVGVISAADNQIEAVEMSNYVDKNVVSSNVETEKLYKASKTPVLAEGESSGEIIKTKVKAPQVALKYKKGSYFKIQVEDRYDDDIKIDNVKVKIKVFTGSKSKVYYSKTNSYGIAKLNTKNLKIGAHKVVISSADPKYSISKTSKIFIGKTYVATLKANSKVLRNKDVLRVKVVNDEDEKEAKVIFKKTPKHTKLLKAKFYLKNKYTGRIIVKVDNVEFDDGRWEVPSEDFSYRYTLAKVKVLYVSY